MYAKVENGQVVYVPTSGVLQDGRTVVSVNDTAVVQGDKVIVTYKAVDLEE